MYFMLKCMIQKRQTTARASKVFGCFTLKIVISLAMVQLEPKHAVQCMTQNITCLPLPAKYILLMVTKY